MIYRIHKGCDDFGNFGPFIKYFNLCQGYIDSSHIYNELVKLKVLSPDFCGPRDFIAKPCAVGVSTGYAYNIYRKVRRGPGHPPRTEGLFYLHPLVSFDLTNKIKEITRDWISSASINGGAVNYNYVVNAPMRFIANPIPAARGRAEPVEPVAANPIPANPNPPNPRRQ